MDMNERSVENSLYHLGVELYTITAAINNCSGGR
jgi:hypothetical protein